MIKIDKVTKIYGNKANANSIVALADVSFNVHKGEFLAIVGRSGCGKTTLMNIIGALDLPMEGKVIFDGIDITKLNEDERADFRNKKTGFIFQSFYLEPYFTVLEI